MCCLLIDYIIMLSAASSPGTRPSRACSDPSATFMGCHTDVRRYASPWRWRRLRRRHNTGFSVTAVKVKQTPHSRWVTEKECCFIPHVLLIRAHMKEEGSILLELFFCFVFWRKLIDWFLTVFFNIIITRIVESQIWQAVGGCLCAHSTHLDLTLEREREGGGESNLVIHVAIFRSTTVGDFLSSCLLWTACERRKRGWLAGCHHTCTSSTQAAS